MDKLPSALRLIGIGWYFALCIVLGLLGGRWLDGKTDLDPLFTLVGLLFGLTLALYGGLRMLMEVFGSITFRRHE